jgi:hypothetical protein
LHSPYTENKKIGETKDSVEYHISFFSLRAAKV